jgi:hypothetical protein
MESEVVGGSKKSEVLLSVTDRYLVLLTDTVTVTTGPKPTQSSVAKVMEDGDAEAAEGAKGSGGRLRDDRTIGRQDKRRGSLPFVYQIDRVLREKLVLVPIAPHNSP